MAPYLEEFKKSTKLESLLLIHDDEIARRVLVGWGIYAPPFDPPDRLPTPIIPLSKAHHAWLWSWCDFDFETLAQLSNVTHHQAIEKWKMLSGNRLIFPDGTIHESATAILRADLRRVLEARKTN